MINNLHKYEEYIRILLGLIIALFASHNEQWLLIPIGVILVYSGSIKYCPIYHLLGRNSEISRCHEILAQLPKNNPEPVFIFDKDGALIFRNKAAEKILPSLTSLEGLQDENENTQFSMRHSQITGFKENDKTYMLHYKTIDKINGVVAYGFNVTELIDANEEIINTQKELLYRMGEIGETRSKETGNHVKRVAEYSLLLAQLSGLDSEQCHLIKMASPMHDIGKVAIPDDILLKPGKLNENEWEVMKTHASIGYNLLKDSERPILKAAAIVAGHHHEKWNGKGYPNGLKGNDIHIFGRITALADVYDALASDRVYKKAWPIEDVIDLIRNEQGEHFDPHLVDLFMEHYQEFDAIRIANSD